MQNHDHCPNADASVPLITIEGTAYDCGRQYAETICQRYPDEREYLAKVADWDDLPRDVARLFADRAPQIIDLHRGMRDVVRTLPPVQSPSTESDCTSFGGTGAVARDGRPLSGQTKDTVAASRDRYIVLRMRIQAAPSILVLAYPGEVLGYGMWSTGMSLFRNSLHSQGGADKGLTMVQWGLLALAGRTSAEAVELAHAHGICASGNFLITDPEGHACAVEFNAGGVDVIDAVDGIATHANHPEGAHTAPFEHYPIDMLKDDSRYRATRLRELLEAKRGDVTPTGAVAMLADHDRHPLGLCRHVIEGLPERCTSAAVVADPFAGALHVTRGNPCENPVVTYTVDGP